MYDYIVYDLGAWPRNATHNLSFKSSLFGEISIVKSSDKETWVYSEYETLVMFLLGILRFLVLIIVHHLMRIIARIIFYC